jgi:hypothetical protein
MMTVKGFFSALTETQSEAMATCAALARDKFWRPSSFLNMRSERTREEIMPKAISDFAQQFDLEEECRFAKD